MNALEECLQLMQKYGAKRVKTSELEVELFAREPETAPADFPKHLGEAERCRCGHEDHEHAGEGYCLRGCDAQSCITKTADSGKMTMAVG